MGDMETIRRHEGIPSPCLRQFAHANEAGSPFLQERASESNLTLKARASGPSNKAANVTKCGSADKDLAGARRTVTVKRVTTSVFAAPCLAPTYIDVPVPVYVPRYIEVPVPVAKLDPQNTQPLQQHRNQLLHEGESDQQRECVQYMPQNYKICSGPPLQKRFIYRSANNTERFMC